MSAGRERPSVWARSLLLVPLMMLTLGSSAQAQVHVALTDLVMADEAPAEAQGEVIEALAAGFQPVATRLLGPSAPVEDAHALVSGRFSQIGQLYEVSVELTLADSGDDLGAVSTTCEVCSWAEALDTVRRAAQGLRDALPGLLALSVSPREATVTIDAAQLTTLDGPIALSPGTHQLEVRSPGYRELSREVSIVAGARADLALSLEPTASSSPVEGGELRGRALQISGWVLGGAAVASLVPGVLWLAFDGQCAIGSDYREGICVELYDTWPQGLALTLVGVGLLSAAIPLLIVHARHDQRPPPVVPTAAVMDGGVQLGVVGRF